MLLCHWRYWLLLPTFASIVWIFAPSALYEARDQAQRNSASRVSRFLLWTPSLSEDFATDFLFDLARELQLSGHTVLVESAGDTKEHSDVHVKSNPRLHDVMMGTMAPWDAIADVPDFIICFSSLWNLTFFELPKARPVRMVWYFYRTADEDRAEPHVVHHFATCFRAHFHKRKDLADLS